MNVFGKVSELLAEKLDCEVSEIKNETVLGNLGIDSLDVMELFMTLEEEFEIEVDIEENNVKTVADLVKMIEGQLK